MVQIFIKIIIRGHGQWDAACHQALQSEFNPWNLCYITEGEYRLWLPMNKHECAHIQINVKKIVKVNWFVYFPKTFLSEVKQDIIFKKTQCVLLDIVQNVRRSYKWLQVSNLGSCGSQIFTHMWSIYYLPETDEETTKWTKSSKLLLHGANILVGRGRMSSWTGAQKS